MDEQNKNNNIDIINKKNVVYVPAEQTLNLP